MLAGDLGKATLPAIIGPNAVVIRFPPGYNRQYGTCAESSRLQKIQDAVQRITGESWTVRLEMALDLHPAPRESVESPATPAKAAAIPSDPLIEAIKSSLDARVMKVDDGFGQAFTTASGDEETTWSATEDE